MTSTCFGHMNGFVHLDLDLGGIEREFDLGVKFELQETRQPYWVLFVSYTSIRPGPVLRGTLRFAMPHSDWTSEEHLVSAEQQALVERATEHVADCLRAIKGGATPRACNEVEHV